MGVGVRLSYETSVYIQQCERNPANWRAFSAGASGGPGGLAHSQEKLPPLGGAVARVFPNVSLAVCPLKLSLASYLLDSGAGTACIANR